MNEASTGIVPTLAPTAPEVNDMLDHRLERGVPDVLVLYRCGAFTVLETHVILVHGYVGVLLHSSRRSGRTVLG